MYFCHSCGTELPDDADFCAGCGTPRQRAEAEQSPFDEGANTVNNTAAERTNTTFSGGAYPQRGTGLKAAGSALSIISAVVYPIIISGVILYLFNTGEASIFGLMAGIIFAAGTGVALGMGGFYLIIIPLPIIFLFKWGCAKPAQKFSRKLTLGLLSLACPAMAFVSAFLF